MDKEIMIQNIKNYCDVINEKPTQACVDAGVGRSFISDIKRGRLPSVAKVADLAAYLGVSTSDLVGDARASPETQISRLFSDLNEEGREKLLEFAEFLVDSKKYTERNSLSVETEAANE